LKPVAAPIVQVQVQVAVPVPLALMALVA